MSVILLKFFFPFEWIILCLIEFLFWFLSCSINKFIFLINIIFSFFILDEVLLLISYEETLLFVFDVTSVLVKLPLDD